MKLRRLDSGCLGLLAGAFLAVGCASSPPPPTDPLPEAIRLSNEERIELAREAFLSGFIYDLQGQAFEALENYRAAAIYDSTDRWLQFATARKLRELRMPKEALKFARRGAFLPGEKESQDYELLAGLWLELGDKDSAQAAWEKVLELAPHSREALLGLGILAERSGDFAKAAQMLTRLLEETESARPLVERTYHLWLQAGKPDSAASLARRIWGASRDPRDGEALARLLIAQDSMVAASQIFDTVSLATDSLDSASLLRFQLLSARLLLGAGKMDSAKVRFLALQARHPDNEEVAASLGALYLESDSIAKARTVFTHLVQQDSANPVYTYFLGVAHMELDSLDSARLWLDRSLARDSLATDAWTRRGLLEIQAAIPARAIPIFQRMSAIYPASAQARWLLGHAFQQQAEKSLRGKSWQTLPPATEPEATALRIEALAQLDTALRIDSGLRRARLERAVVLERLHRFDQAIEEFRRLLATDSSDAVTLNYLGFTLADLGRQLDEADRLLHKALALDSDNPAYLDSRGWLRFRQGRLQEGLADIERSLALGLSDPVVIEHRAVILERLGRHREALEAWAVVLEADPSYGPAVEAVDRLKSQQRSAQ